MKFFRSLSEVLGIRSPQSTVPEKNGAQEVYQLFPHTLIVVSVIINMFSAICNIVSDISILLLYVWTS